MKNNLFEFDRNIITPCHCKKVQNPDVSTEAATQEKNLGLLRLKPRNDIILIGTDEAGRGPGAGGVFASAVCFANGTDKKLIKELSDLNDSKKLSKKKREELYEIIIKNTINSTICIEVEEIEKINILNASLKAMKLAVENVINTRCQIHNIKNDILILVDGNKPIKITGDLPLTIYSVVKGDGKSASIAAASILAKVSRDRYMQELDKKFPHYNWKQNAGYMTKEHLEAVEKYGLTPIHRKSFFKKQTVKQLSLY